MIDRDLAELYGVETKALNQVVKRNITRFPEDFMFQLTKEEKTEVVTNCDHLVSLKYSYRLPYDFTENGVAMLSSVLNSEKAIQVNIQIMRAFNFLKKKYLADEEIKKEIEHLDKKIDFLAARQQEDVTFIFIELDRLDKLIELRKIDKKQIGFKKED